MSELNIGEFESEGVWQLRDRRGRVELYQNHLVTDWSDGAVWRVFVYPNEKREEKWYLCGAFKGTEQDARQQFSQICHLVRLDS